MNPAIIQVRKYLALVIVLSGVLFIVLSLLSGDPDSGDEVIADRMESMKLPDASRVTLQKGSSMTLGDFSSARSVEMVGRAHIEIGNGEGTLSIMTKSAIIRSGEGALVVKNLVDGTTEVFVISGTAQIYHNPKAFEGSNMMLELKAGEIGEVTVGNRGIRKRKIKDENYISWKTGKYVFQGSYMSQVGTLLEEDFGYQIKYANPSIQRCRLTGEFSIDMPTELLNQIAEKLNIKYELTDQTLTFSGDGCR